MGLALTQPSISPFVAITEPVNSPPGWTTHGQPQFALVALHRSASQLAQNPVGVEKLQSCVKRTKIWG